jgi:hypothetical protein
MEKNKMFKNENDFKNIVSRLNIDDKTNPEHRQNLHRQMLSTFNQTGKSGKQSQSWPPLQLLLLPPHSQ